MEEHDCSPSPSTLNARHSLSDCRKGVLLVDLHPVDILISIINIAVLFILLRLILWKYINRFLSARTERVRSELDGVEKSRIEVDALRKEYEDKLDGLELQGREIMRGSQIKAAEEAEEIIKEARATALNMINEARDRIAEEKERAIISARHEVAQLATDMAARILRREVSADDSKNAVDDFFRETR